MHDLRPENPAERWVYRSLIYTWPIYAVGGLYVLGPVLGWTLGGLALTALYLGPAMRADLRPNAVPPMVWIWVIGMLLMLPILWIGHVNWGFGTKTIIRSTIGRMHQDLQENSVSGTTLILVRSPKTQVAVAEVAA